MKKVLIVLIAIVLLPIIVFAKEYKVDQTDLSIVFDEEKWYVFARNNIKDSEELAYLNVTEEYMENFFKENNAYLDALLINEDGTTVEIFVRKTKIDSINNLSNFDNKYVTRFAKELAKKQNSKNYNVFETKYKYAHLDYKDKDLFLEEYYTVVNKDGYTITAQSPTKFSKDQVKMIEDIVKSITFKVDPTLKDKTTTFNWNRVLLYAVVGAIIGGIIGAINGAVTAMAQKKKLKNSTIEENKKDKKTAKKKETKTKSTKIKK